MTNGMRFENTFDLLGRYMDHLETCPERGAEKSKKPKDGELEPVVAEAVCNCGVKEAKNSLADLKKRYTEHATNSGKLKKLVEGIPKMVTSKREQGQRMATDNDTAAANANGIFGVCNELDKIMKDALGEPPWNT